MDNNYKPDYGMDSYDKQSYGKDNSYDKSIDSNVKCNNINANLNGIEVGTLPTALRGLASDEAQASDEGEIGASSFESGGSDDGRPSGHDSDSRFVCINNNNNIVGGAEPIQPVPPVDECLLCFEETSQAVRDAVIAALEAEGPLVIVPGVYEVSEDVTTIERLCEWLTENSPLELIEIQIELLINSFVDANPGLTSEQVDDLVDCLIEADLIEVVIPTCDDCFDVLGIEVIDITNNALLNLGDIPIPTTNIVIPAAVNDVIALCEFLDTQVIEVDEANLPLLFTLFQSLTGTFLGGIVLVNCLVDAGIINVTGGGIP